MASKGRRPSPPASRRREPVPRRSPRSFLLPVVGALGLVALAVVVLAALYAPASAPPAIRDITVAQLRAELQHKDFTLVDVKTPYIGEIAGTDLYIPYDQLQSRAAELPTDKKAKIVVYCRTGNESTIAAHTLASLGYAHIENLTGGMQAWTAAGGTIVQLNR